MYIQVITLFPGLFVEMLKTSMMRKAIEEQLVLVEVLSLRKFGLGKRQVVDDKPYGGGDGMILRVDVLDEAIEFCRQSAQRKFGLDSRVILLTPQGITYKQATCRQLAEQESLVLVCGHYEGVDERIRDLAIDQEISIGDYVLTGGEIPAMAVLDSVIRLLPGVLSSPEASLEESFEQGLLEYPHYTRPDIYKDQQVPQVLLSGHHAQVKAWREQQSLQRTQKRRPDLLKK